MVRSGPEEPNVPVSSCLRPSPLVMPLPLASVCLSSHGPKDALALLAQARMLSGGGTWEDASKGKNAA